MKAHPFVPVAVKVREWLRADPMLLGALSLTVLLVLLCYGTTLGTMADRWSHDPQYSHGFLVPVFAAVVLWFRRPLLKDATAEPSWWGLPFLIGALGLRLAGAAIHVEALEAFSLLPTLAGLVLLLGGRGYWRWSWPAVAFLGFMLPMPFQLEIALAQPLRRLGTEVSTYVLQTLGFPALAEGNIIYIDELKLGVVDACSGLGMLVTFFALATATAMISRAPLVDRLVLVVSAIPIALIANITRITVTAWAHWTLGEAAGKAVMHDLAGLLMMPLALLLIWLELRLLACLFAIPDAEPARPLNIHGVFSQPGKNTTDHDDQGPQSRLLTPSKLHELPSMPAHTGG